MERISKERGREVFPGQTELFSSDGVLCYLEQFKWVLKCLHHDNTVAISFCLVNSTAPILHGAMPVCQCTTTRQARSAC